MALTLTGDYTDNDVYPICDRPSVVFEELMEEIRDHLTNQPRNLQLNLGPSELGDPCDRAMIAKLMHLPKLPEPPNWRAYVGTCMHNGMETIFGSSFMNQADPPRFLLEQKVTVGRIGDWDLTGSCDLFDTLTGCVWDWKSKSPTQHGLARKHGMGTKYRVQFHAYGMGMVNAGYNVRHVGGIFMLRDGELASTFPLYEPYNPMIVYAALGRATRLQAIGRLFGAEAAMALYPPCTEPYCRVCNNYRAPFGAPRAVATTIKGLLANN